MRRAAFAFAAVLALGAGPALAIDAGTANGHYKGDGASVPRLSHSVALLLDNAESQLDHPREMRVLLSEEGVPASAALVRPAPPARSPLRDSGMTRSGLLVFSS